MTDTKFKHQILMCKIEQRKQFALKHINYDDTHKPGYFKRIVEKTLSLSYLSFKL